MDKGHARRLLDLVPAPYALGVGYVITQWAWVEAIIDQFIWRLLGTRALRGRIVTSALPARGKMEMLAALMRKSKMDERLVREIQKRGNALADARNHVAHGNIAVPPNAKFGMTTSYRAKGRLTDRGRMVTPEALEAVAIQIGEFLLFLISQEAKFPKQRGIRRGPTSPAPRPRPLRAETMIQRLPPLLVVDLGLGLSHEEIEAARLAKRAQRATQGQRSIDGDRTMEIEC